MSFDVAANATERIWAGQPGEMPDRQVLTGKLDVAGITVSRCRYFFTIFADIGLPVPELYVEQIQDQGNLTITLSSDQYARGVHWHWPPAIARPDDNYFDLFPDETREVVIRGLSGDEMDRVTVALAIQSS